MFKILLALACLSGFMISCQPASKESAKEGDHQDIQHGENVDEEESYLLPGLNHGLLQSPINILSEEAVEGKHNITLNFTGNINKVENLGHTVQLDLVPGNTISLDGKTFEYKQMHFHTPSEHMIDGITYPMEMHVVTTLEDQPEGETPEYLVLGFLIRMGKENKFFAQWLNQVPKEEGGINETDFNVLKNSEIGSAENLLKEIQSSYHYKGSLTTPPYTESVNWYVMKRIFEASPEQILKINEIEGDNARHIQARYKRSISSE
jgi:carbonic anhydrase